MPADSILTFRSKICDILKNETAHSQQRNIIVFAVDGIPYSLAADTWKHASLTEMSSVFPTTSSTAWLSALTGMEVNDHGVPGVVFKINTADTELTNLFNFRGKLVDFTPENIFSDALRSGYQAISIPGDLQDLDCSWKNLLLKHSVEIKSDRFYAVPEKENISSVNVCQNISDIIDKTLQENAQEHPCLIWCFIDVDLYIHYYGYDKNVDDLLKGIEEIALTLTSKNNIVVAHSDHGLTPTHNNKETEQILNGLLQKYNCEMGGAGRTRWLYPAAGKEQQLITELKQLLGDVADVYMADDLFKKGSLSRARTGNIVLIAKSAEFIAPQAYQYDHGSLLPEETAVPFAVWKK